jgi:drug/metabolite transporter (DMT)-like permease
VNRKPLDYVAFATMVLCCFLWGFTNVTTKLAATDVSPVMQGGLRSILATYLAWFWLLTRYLAGRLAVFGFLTPLFGVMMGAIVLSEPLRPAFLAALAMVGTGIFLVNRPAPPG